MSVKGELNSLRRPGPGRQRTARRRHRDNRAGYLFLLPWLVGLCGITIGPMLISLYLSFTSYNLLRAPRWIGVGNFIQMWHDSLLRGSLRVTFIYVFVAVPLQLLVALAVAVVLNRGMRGLSLYRSIFYLPSMLGGSVAVSVLWRKIFGSQGLVNDALNGVGIPAHLSWVGDPRYALGTIILLHAWTFGAPMVIFLAGLRQIPEIYYQAASIDGATRRRRFISITLPLLSPIIFFNLVLQVIAAFQSFTQAYIVSGGTGGPVNSTLFYTLYLYKKGFTQFQMGYASAMAWFLLVVVAVITGINFLASKYWVFYDD